MASSENSALPTQKLPMQIQLFGRALLTDSTADDEDQRQQTAAFSSPN